MDSIASALGMKTFAGFVGGIISLRFFEGLTLQGKAWTVGGGMVMSFFLTHPIMDYFKWNVEHYEGGVGFIVGLFGMSVAAAAAKLVTDSDVLKSWLKRG